MIKVIPIMSGKGGVGKSSCSVNIAVALKNAGKKVGIVDLDITGSNIPKILNIHHKFMRPLVSSVEPIDYNGLKLASIANMTENDDQPIFMIGEKRRKFVDQLLRKIEWGKLDYLIADMPPGSGDEVVMMLRNFRRQIAGAIIITTPSKVAVADVRKTIGVCRKQEIKITGIVNNMTSFICPNCNTKHDIFNGDSLVDRMCLDFGVKVIANIPIIPTVEKDALIVNDYFQPVVKEITRFRIL